MTAEEYITQHWIPNKIWTHLTWPKHQKRLHHCTEFLKGNRFADVGCACGHSTKMMSEFKEGDWTGIDGSGTGIVMARKLFPELTFRLCKDNKYLDELNPFDSVVCAEVIEHVEDDQEFVNALVQITSRVLVITTPNVIVDDPGHCRCYTGASLRNLFERYNHFIHSDGNYYFVVVRKEGQDE